MKRLFILYILLLLCRASYSQALVTAEGIYVIRYAKKDIKRPMFVYDGVPYYLCLPCKKFYFVTKLNNYTICNGHDILDILSNYKGFANTQHFVFPPFTGSFQKYTEGIPITQKSFPKGKLLKIKSKQYVYYAYQVKGNAIRIRLDNDILNSKEQRCLDSLWNYSPPVINRSIPAYYTYLWTDYDISPIGIEAFCY